MLLRIEPVDPVMTRDGRPFDDTPGSMAHTMEDVSPGMVAGTIRTLLLKDRSRRLSAEERVQLMKQLRIAGPLLEWNGNVYFPMPADLIVYEHKDEYEESGVLKVARLRPQTELGAGEGYFGVAVEGSQRMELLPPQVEYHGKPYAGAPSFVCADWMYNELCGAISDEQWSFELNRWKEWRASRSREAAPPDSPFLNPYEMEMRVHNATDDATGRTEEGKLFSTEALRFKPGVCLLASVRIEGGERNKRLDALHSMGGKRRLSHFQEIDWPKDRMSLWSCPEHIASALRGAKRGDLLRMTLATPAYFLKGWRPRWVDTNFHTNKHLFECWKDLPESDPLPLQLKLQWACVDQWLPVSGWSYSRTTEEGREKPVRRMVPAGSVYFFEIVGGDAGVLVDHWLESVSDTRRRKGPLDREDGFGLAMWGIVSKEECQQ